MKRYLRELGFFIFIDILAFALLWAVLHRVGATFEEINSKIDTIKFYGQLFMMLIGLVGPALHILFTIEFLKPGTLNKEIIKGLDTNKLLWLILAASVALAYISKYNFINYIENNGYTYCAEMSERATFSKVYVFVRNGVDCGAK